MTDRSSRPRFCGRCGKPLQETDRFCGSCGASVSPIASDDAQIIPQRVAAAQGAAYGGSRRRIAGGVVVAAVALLVLGGAAAFAFGGGLGLLGGSGEEQQAGRPEASDTSQSESTTPPGESSDEEEDAVLKEFARDYDAALRGEDWSETYSMLDELSKEEFTQDEWAEAQGDLVDAEVMPAPLESVTVDQNEEVTDTPARITLYYEDGTEETITAGIPMVVTEDSDAGEPKRTLTEDEIEDLREYLPVETTTTLPDAESETDQRIEAFVREYYEAVEQGDWSQTYSLLADASREQLTEDEWTKVQQIRESTDGGSSSLESVGEIEDVAEFVVSVGLEFSDGTTGETTVFVFPNGEEPRRILSPEDVEYLRGLLSEEETGLQTVDSPSTEQFVYEYYGAFEDEDWSATYSTLSYDSQEQFTEEEWIEAQETRQAVSGPPGSVASVEVRAGEDYPADPIYTVTVTFSDGTAADIQVVDTHGPDGLVRVLTDDEVSYLKSL